MNLTEFIYELN